MAVSVQDLCNAALRRVKYPTPIGSMYEGSRASRVALDYYAQTRDNLFGSRDWPFLRRQVSLGPPIKTAPVGGYGSTPWTTAYPPVPWIYEYGYPDDCIEVRSVRPTPAIIPENLPWPNVFVTAYDSALAAKVVLTNLVSAQAIMTARVTNPNEWQDSNFTEALIDALAVNFEKALSEDLNAVNLAERDAAMATNSADARRG